MNLKTPNRNKTSLHIYIQYEATMEKSDNVVVDEQDSKEAVLQRYFVQEWEQVKSILHTIISNGRVVDLSSVGKIRSIVSHLDSIIL